MHCLLIPNGLPVHLEAQGAEECNGGNVLAVYGYVDELPTFVP